MPKKSEAEALFTWVAVIGGLLVVGAIGLYFGMQK